MADSGFVIAGETYPFPTAFRLCDPVLVSKLTGMSWMEFVEALEDGGAGDPVVMAGMVGVSVWQANPRWTREKAIRFVESLDLGALEVRGGDEDDAVPPPEEDKPSPSDGSAAESSLASDGGSETNGTLSSSGTSASDISSPDSLPTV